MTITILHGCFSLYARTREGWLKKRPETESRMQRGVKIPDGKKDRREKAVVSHQRGVGANPLCFRSERGVILAQQPAFHGVDHPHRTLVGEGHHRLLGVENLKRKQIEPQRFPRGVTHVFGIRVLRRSVTKLRRLHKPGKPGQ